MGEDNLMAKQKINSLQIQPDSWVIPTYQNSWVTYAVGDWNDAAYRVDATGYVHLKGMVKNGVIGQAIFTLPVGARPLTKYLMATISNSVIGRLDVYPSGAVIASNGSNAWFSIDGITFKAEQ